MLKGIDVSHWQGTIDWLRVKASGVQFAYMKSTEGNGWSDSKFAANWAGAKVVGIPRGAYHFWRRAYSGESQAGHFLNTVGAEFDRPPLVVDVEDTAAPRDPSGNGANLASMISGLGGLSKMIYTAKWYWDPWFGNTSSVQALATIPLSGDYWASRGRTRLGIKASASAPRRSGLLELTRVILANFAAISHKTGPGASLHAAGFASIPLWVAHYTTAAAPYMPVGWTSWLIWQYTSSGRVDGISGNVDMNRAWEDLLGVIPPPPGGPTLVEIRYPKGSINLSVVET